MMNQKNQNVSFEVIEELFQGLDGLLRNRRKGGQGSPAVREQSQPATRPDLSRKSPATLKPRLERAPR